MRATRIFSALYYIVICGLSSCTIFSTLCHKWHDFRRNVIGHI